MGGCDSVYLYGKESYLGVWPILGGYSDLPV